MESLGREFLSGTQSLGKAQMTIGFYISVILSVVSFIGILLVFFMFRSGWKKATADVTKIECSTSQETETINNKKVTKTTHPSTYSISWDVNGTKKTGKITKNTTVCTQCEGPSGCSPSKVSIIYDPNNDSNISLGVNTKMIIILILFVLMLIFIISAVIDRVFRNNKAMQTLSGLGTEASLIKRII